jgi:tetratricopeptide (TPR) repeat protein
MFPLPDGRALLRWMFVSLGLIILSAPEFTVNSILRADRWAAFLFPGDPAAFTGFMAASYVYIGLTPLLCLATAFGLKRNRSWARWTGTSASSLLLFGFPLLTVAGALGLYALFAKPRRPDPQPQPAPRPKVKTAGYWASRSDPKRDSKAQPIVAGIAMIFGFQGLALLTLYAQRSGMPAWNPGWTWWLYLFLFLFLQTALHELGHAAMAWTLYFRVRTIAIGPLIFWNDGYGYQFRFEWNRLFDSRGYMGAAPVSDDDLLFRQIATVASGPFLTLLVGGFLLLLFLCLPGTAWQGVWWIVAFNAVLGICHAVMNLVPLGYSDGAMLYHLVRETPAGRHLLNHLKFSLIQEQADAAHSRADFEKEVELRQAALLLAQECSQPNAMAIAFSHQALGHARLAFEDWPGAQAEFLKSLECNADCEFNPGFQANSWSGLQKAGVERYCVFEAGRANAAAVKAAVEVVEELKQNRNRTSVAVARTMLAQVHLRAGERAAALAEADAALAALPRHRQHLMLHAMLHSVRAVAYLNLGAVEDGVSAAREAAAVLGSPEIPEAQRNLAAAELGELGEGLWKAGQSDRAIRLMQKTVNQLESGGAAVTAAQYRIKLAAALRATGRDAEALYILPDEETLPPGPRRRLLAERVELHLAAARHREAVADGRALLRLWQCEPDPPATEIAVAEGLLARACLETADSAAAEALARHAADVLAPWGHPDAAGCRITLALASRERSRTVFDEALRSIEADPLLSPAEKTRRLDAERARIDRSGPIEGTATLVRLAPAVCA